MNIVSALLRTVGRHAYAQSEYRWRTLGSFMDDWQAYRDDDSRFLYPPSCRHVHFNPSSASRDGEFDDAVESQIVRGGLHCR